MHLLHDGVHVRTCCVELGKELPLGQIRLSPGATGIVYWRRRRGAGRQSQPQGGSFLRTGHCCATIAVLSHPIWQRGGGVCMATLLDFLVSVIASVVGSYISKWLGGHDSDN